MTKVQINKVALVTGATSGMGLAIAKQLTAEDCAVILVARRSPNQAYQGHAAFFAADLTEGPDVDKLASYVGQAWGKIDFLVNCAGGNQATSDNDLYDRAFDHDLALNLKSVHLCCKLLSGHIRDQGAIVNLASVNGQSVPAKTGLQVKMGYAAAKAGVVQLTKLYAMQLAPRGIRVNAVSPGVIYPTGMTQDWSKAKQAQVIKETPLGRLGTVQDVANAVSFLLSDSASFVTGHTLSVNGGRYML